MEQQTVLIVDDDATNCEVLRRSLQRSRYRVVIANSGREALQELGGPPTAIDLVLLDLRMPGMNGIDTLKLIRIQYSASELPVIMVTAEGDTATVVEALDSGANDYITKPVELPVLLARVRIQLSQKRLDKSLRDSQERYELAARGSDDGFWDLDRRTGALYLGEQWMDTLGYADVEISPTLDFWTGLMHPEDRGRFLESMEQHCSRKLPKLDVELRILHKDGSSRWVLIRGMAVWDADGNATRIAGSQTDIMETRAHDALTKLPNGVNIRERVTAALQRCRRVPGESCAVLFLDLDRLKTINDSLGHRAGDAMLVEVARRLKCALRPDRDVPARFGGDEFVLLLGSFRAVDDLSGMAESLLRDITQPLVLSGHKVFPRASVGIAIATPDVSDADEFIHNAETAMYVVVRQGISEDLHAIEGWELIDKKKETMLVALLFGTLENHLLRKPIDGHGKYQPDQRPKSNLVAGRNH